MNSLANKYRAWLIILFFASLPFERLLTLDVGGYTLKLSYIFGLILIVDTAILLIKKLLPATLYRDELALLALAALSFLTIAWSIDKPRSLFISLATLFVFTIFYVLRRIVSQQLREKIINLTIWLGFFLSIFAFYQFFADKSLISHFSLLRPEYQSGVFVFARVQATFLEPLLLANFLMIPIFFCLYRLGQKSTLMMNILLLIISVAFFLTLSRGADIALLISLVFVGLIRMFYQRDKINAFLKQAFIIVAAFALAVICVFAVSGREGINQYLDHTTFADTEKQGSVVERQDTIEIASEESLEHPFGIGAGAFGALPQFSDKLSNNDYQTANDLYLEISAELGFLGLILFILFVWNYTLSLVSNFSKDKLWTTLSIGLFLAILVQYLFFSTIYIIYIWAILALLAPKFPTKLRI